MDHSYLFFGGCKIVEVLFTSASLVLHIHDILSLDETVPLAFLWCIAYGMFAAISIGIAVVFLIVGRGLIHSTFRIAMITATSLSSSFYFFMSLMNMYELNEDEHLDYIPDEEEHKHPFFVSCVGQSVVNMMTALVLLVDTIVQADVFYQLKRSPAIHFDHEQVVEIEASDAIEFNCWLCSVPEWWRCMCDELASWWRVCCFKLRFGRFWWQRRRRRRPNADAHDDAPPPPPPGNKPNAATSKKAGTLQVPTGAQSTSRSGKSIAPDITLTPPEDNTRNMNSAARKVTNFFRFTKRLGPKSDVDDEDVTNNYDELDLRVEFSQEVTVE